MARRRLHVDAELDVIPVMSLIVHLIPMILLSVRFMSLAHVPGQGPVVPTREATGPEQLAEQQARVVSVRIGGEGFVVGGLAAGEPRIPCAGACAPETYDYASLNRTMALVKQAHPEEQRVVLVPEPAVPYEVLVRVMDATRARKTDKGEQVLFPVPLLAAGAGEGKGSEAPAAPAEEAP